MIELVKFLVKEFADSEVKKYSILAEEEAEKIRGLLQQGIEVGMHNAVERATPKVVSAALGLGGALFFLFGVARLIDEFFLYDGSGFVIVGVLAIIISRLVSK